MGRVGSASIRNLSAANFETVFNAIKPYLPCDSLRLSQTADTRGVSQIMELMALKATDTMGSGDIMERLDSLGAQIYALSSRDNYTMSVDCLRDNVEDAAAIWKSCLMNGVYEESEVEEVRTLVHAQIQ